MNIVDLVFRAKTEALDAAGKKLDDLGKKANSAQNSSFNVGKALTALRGPVQAFGLVVTATAGSLAALAYASINAADKLNDLGVRSNLATDRLSLLDKIAKMADSSVTELVASSEMLATKLARQDEESGKAAMALDVLGVSAKGMNGEMKSTLQLQEEIVAAVDNATDKAKAEGAALVLLGNNYYKLRGAIREVIGTKDEFYDYMEKTGQIVLPELSKQSGIFNDTLDIMGGSLVGLGNTIATLTLPTLNGWLQTANGWLVSIVAKIRELSGLAPASVYVDKGMSEIDKKIQNAENTIKKLTGTEYAKTSQGERAIAEAKAQVESLQELRREYNRAGAAAKTFEAAKKAEVINGKPGEGNRPAGTPGKPDKPKTIKEEKIDTGSFVSGGSDWEEEFARYTEAQNDIKRKYFDMLDPLQQYTDMLTEIRRLRELGMINAEQQLDLELMVETKRQEALENTLNSTKDTADAFDFMKRVGQTAFSGLEQSLVSLATTGKFSFSGLVSSILSDIAKMIIQLKVIKPLMDSMFNKSGGLASDGLGGLVQGGLKWLGGFFADGGRPPMGKVSMVGERGPELFVPDSAGSIIPNHRLGGMGGSGGTVQQIAITVNVEGGKDAQETGNVVSSEIVKVMRGIIKQEISSDKRQMAYAV